MPPPDDKCDYVDAIKLASATGLSVATIRRLKKAGKICFYQPGGDGHSVRFPPDAIERRITGPEKIEIDRESLNDNLNNVGTETDHDDEARVRLPGPKPKWMR